METIKIQSLEKYYRDKSLFKPVNLEISHHERLAVLGPSGRGKTTFLKIVAGLVKPTFGRIDIPKDHTISMVFQENLLLEGFHGVDNIKSVVNWKEERILSWLQKLSLEKDGYQFVHNYSGGMKRRLALLRALAVKPRILLLDEAFREVDERNKNAMVDLVLSEMENKILIFTTHDNNDLKMLKPTKCLELEECE
ncbi:MAG: ATP-binding cassette domain-containing protein [Tissierellia bacterium]|nr:ATP-binding cassette domain-containing protein [Tissierellia bacterium]